jgi:predicted translin family RNA/ssDNA-binding protein
MINKKFIQKLKEDYDKKENERRQIINLADIVLHSSKRTIFSLHRGDLEKAKKRLTEIEKTLQKLEKDFGHKRVSKEGSYRAGAEEFVEAKMFYFVMAGKKVDKIKEVNLNIDSYLGGLCDLTGELVRKAINQAAENNFTEVGRMKKIINEIMAELVEFDMTGYLRTKYDQAKNNLRKIEQIEYEVRMRK